ncbi:MAG TPA: hypothetical protein VKM72_11090 [Thermoanaerobaculia bacterium]|nr:hypothetical protein [Thermoanaerobaculia bacterium]
MNGGWQSTHLNLSALDLKFREVAKGSPEFLDRAHFKILDETKELLHYRLQSWPTFVGPEKLADLKRVGIEVSRLIRSVPEKIFRNDPVKLAGFYGLGSPWLAEVLFDPPTGAETMLSRGDLIETASGFKCIEWNFTPSLGGWDTTIITSQLLSASPTSRFIESERLRPAFTDTMLEMFRFVIDDLRGKGIIDSGELTIAFVTHAEEVPHIAGGLYYFDRELQRTIEAMGIDLQGRTVACTAEDLVPAEDGLHLADRRVGAVIELGGNGTPPHVYRQFKGNLVGLYNGPMNTILSNKRNVALLSQHAASGAFSAEEHAFIGAHVPWTRLVAPGEIDYEGKMSPLAELLMDRQEQFVLKDASSYGGAGVVLGRFASPETWRQTLDNALAKGDWVVQEILESLPYLYQSGDYGCSIHDVIWGPFVFGERYGGVVLRMQPKAAGGAVNLSLSATEGIVLEI